MKLENIIAVSGFPGLYKLLATRSNGLLIESFENGKRQFVSGRIHQFTPLVSIGIYTYTDVEGLDEVLKKLHETESTNPLPDPNDKSDTLRAWFKQIVPDHDEERVHINDIRKLIKWYLFLKQYAWEQITAEVEEPKAKDEGSKEAVKEAEKKEERIPEQKVDKIPEKKVEKMPEKKVEKIPEKKVEKAPEKKVEKAPEKKVEKAPEKKVVKKVEKKPLKKAVKKAVKKVEKTKVKATIAKGKSKKK